MKIGYVGLGAMGSSLAKWLVADHDLMVRDLNPAAMARFVEMGAKAAGSLTELARECEVIFLCLPRSKNVADAIFGEGGLAEGLTAGKVIVDQTSGVATETAKMADRLAQMGVTLMDAPVAGGVPSAVAGTITIMLSGPDEAQERAMPALKAMTAKIYRASPQAGDAQSVKTLNNMMNMVFRVATLELACLAVRLGVPLESLTDRLKAGQGGNFTCRTVLPAIIEGRSTGDFALTLMLKDNNQALILGMQTEVPMPLSALARGVLQQNINLMGPSANLDDCIVYMEKVCGLAFRDGPQGSAEPEHVIGLVETALAATNRAVAYEILSVATRLGMKLADFGEILANGSAWSAECVAVLAELAGGAAPARTIGQTVLALREIEKLNLYEGVATIMLGEVRAVYETAACEVGADQSVAALAGVYERIGGISLHGA